MIPLELRGALRHLTVLPVPWTEAEADIAPSRTLVWFPVVGMGIGAVTALMLLPPIPVYARAALALAMAVALTGGLHEDGVMDTADAAFAPVTREQRLDILRDPRVGALGATAGALALLLRFGALAGVATAAPVIAPVVAAAVGRWTMTLSLAGWPSARPGGLGARFAEGARAVRPAVSAVALSLLVVAALLAEPVRVVAAAGAALAAGLGSAAWLARRFGGLSGDAHGAVGVVAETAALYAFLPFCVGGVAC